MISPDHRPSRRPDQIDLDEMFELYPEPAHISCSAESKCYCVMGAFLLYLGVAGPWSSWARFPGLSTSADYLVYMNPLLAENPEQRDAPFQYSRAIINSNDEFKFDRSRELLRLAQTFGISHTYDPRTKEAA